MNDEITRLCQLHNLKGRSEMRQIIIDFISENKDSTGAEGKRVFDSLLQLMLETIMKEEDGEASLQA